ncbi:COP1-interactive protein 1-like [Nicotiana tomentosiformis]|uniref:COP1-interactive protein 1-like n=1 Tax=Nicotiana tomentosiformis TaxID=4098 RepID=UPI00388C7CB1
MIEITESPSFTDSMYNKAQTVKERPNEVVLRADDSFRDFFDGVDSTATEGVIRLGDLEIPRKSPSSRESGPSSSPKLALVLHHETFIRYLAELKQLEAEAEVLGLTEKRDSYKLLSEQRGGEGEAKSLRAELEVARKEHADLVEHIKIFEVSNDELGSVTNYRNPKVQQKIDQVAQLQFEKDTVKDKTDEWRSKMDRLASEKEVARVQLTSAEVHLRAAKERAEVQAKKVEELQSLLSSAASNRKIMAKELEMAKSAAAVVKADGGPI